MTDENINSYKSCFEEWKVIIYLAFPTALLESVKDYLVGITITTPLLGVSATFKVKGHVPLSQTT